MVTAYVYLRRLGHLCSDLKMTPQNLAEMNEDQLYDLLLDIVSRMEKEDCSGSYIHSQLKAVKSWLLHNRIEVRRKIKVRGVEDTPVMLPMSIAINKLLVPPTQWNPMAKATPNRIKS